MADQSSLLEDQFRELLKQSFPGTALTDFPPDQLREMRRMFMAGARAIHKILDTYMDPNADEPTTVELAVAAALEAEMADFADAVLEGRA